VLFSIDLLLVVGRMGRLQFFGSTFRAEFGLAKITTALDLLFGKRRINIVSKNTAVFGIYETDVSAEKAVDNLISAGFPSGDVSVLLPDIESSKDLAHEKNTKAPEGATAGVATGGAVGGTLGLLAGIGALAIPGLGPFIAAGPIMAALAGLGVGGALGGVVGALVGMGIPEYEAKLYEGHVKEGGVLLSVHCDRSEEVSRAKDILTHTGATDIASTGEATADSPKPALRATSL
jgi:hypothetical protein